MTDDRLTDDAGHLTDAGLAAFKARQDRMFARYGYPAQYDTAQALDLLGKTGEIQPDEAIAFLYPSREAAEAFADSNLLNGGLPSLGIMEVAGGWLGAVDIRPDLARVKADHERRVAAVSN